MERNQERPGAVRSARTEEHDEDRGEDMGAHQEVHDAELPQTGREEHLELFSRDDTNEMSDRWEEIQRVFIDDPRRAVTQADRLVSDTMQQLSNQFLSARRRLEEQWDRGGDASTEDLRQAMQQYRAFFRRLLAI
ncbi:MAG: hypothetical protein M0R74_10735 [Dehalococcoidia bacterium]|nr:hypothetical protein [Dehalococcoidia bacterium]